MKVSAYAESLLPRLESLRLAPAVKNCGGENSGVEVGIAIAKVLNVMEFHISILARRLAYI